MVMNVAKIFFLGIFLIVSTFDSHCKDDDKFNLCGFEFSYKVKKNSSNDNAIEVELIRGEGDFVFQLIDRNDIASGYKQTTEFKSVRPGDKLVIFRNLESSVYFVNINHNGKKCGLSDQNGITIN